MKRSSWDPRELLVVEGVGTVQLNDSDSVVLEEGDVGPFSLGSVDDGDVEGAR